MASCETSQWVSTSPYVVLNVTQQSSTATSVTLKYELIYHSDYGAANTSVNKDYSVTINGSTVKSGTVDIDGVTAKSICSGTVTINKGTSSKTISFSCSFAFNLTWSGSYCGTKTASGSISIPALSGYTVSYNANGGTGAPSSQTKVQDVTLKLSSTKPTRSNYTFVEWNTKADGSGTSYNPGSNYTSNASVTLYAIWTGKGYTVSYNANGGSGAPSSQTKVHGTALTLSSTKPTRTGYTFQGWATSASGSVKYQPGAKYTEEEAVTLYAVWSSNYVKPKITGLSADRCDSSGSLSDSGTYASVKFNWETYNTVLSVKIKWKVDSSSVTTWSETSVAVTGTSGTVGPQVIGGGSLDNETTYSICITVDDGTETTEKYTFVSGMSFPIDVLGKGPSNKQGVAIGKPAESEETFDVNWLTRLRKSLCIGNKTGYLDGKQGVYINGDGYMHIQRTASQNNHPYIAFLLDNDKSSSAVEIRYNSNTKQLELINADVNITKALNVTGKVYSTGANDAFTHIHPTSGANISFGVGTLGTNRGIWDTTTGHWLFKYDGTDVFIQPQAGEIRPYYKKGDSLKLTNFGTAGYVTNGMTDIHFAVPLNKPIVGTSTVTASTSGGFVFRQASAYKYDSTASTGRVPTSIKATINGSNSIDVVVTISTNLNSNNNDVIGVLAKDLTLTFS